MKKLKYLIFMLLMFAAISLPAVPIGLSMPNTSGVAGEMIDLPVIVEDDLTGQGVISYQLQINYTNSRLSLEDVVTTGTLTQSLGNFTFNQTANNQVQISAAGSSPLNGEGTLIILRFKMLSSGTATLAFTDTLNNFFNEGSPSVNLQNGRIVIAAAPVITVNPNTGLLAVGETLNMSVSSGTAPYSWSVTDPAKGTIVSTSTNAAQFTALASGFTRIAAVDDNGVADTTNGLIEIRPIKLDLPDSVITQGQSVDIPILTSDLTGLGIISGQMSIQFNANILKVTDVLTANSLLAGSPDVSFSTNGGTLSISFAGTSDLAGSGVLCYVRMSSNFVYSGTSSLTLSAVVFNESILAKLYPGSCRVNKLPALTLSPQTATLFTGDTLRFSVTNGGVEPLVWSTSNPTIATITNEGLLTSLQGGTVKVSVTDAASATGTTGNINIYDTQVTIPDSAGTISGFVDLPVYIDSIRSPDFVFSIQGTFSFDTTILSIKNVITDDAIGTGWTYAANIEDNKVNFAGAGTNGVRAAGKIATLRFLIKAGINNGARGNVILNELLLNEGNPVAFVQNGSITGSVSDIPPTPALISPAEGASVAPDAGVFIWTRSLGAQNYHLQIDTANDFSNPAVDNEDIGDSIHVVTTLTDLSTYFWRVRASNIIGTSGWSSIRSFQSTINDIEQIGPYKTPNDYVLEQNYPNPFNPNTTIEFSVPQSTNVLLEIYNSLGERVDLLVNKQLSAGNYRIEWRPEHVASGIYYYRLSTKDHSAVKRMLLIQ